MPDPSTYADAGQARGSDARANTDPYSHSDADANPRSGPAEGRHPAGRVRAGDADANADAGFNQSAGRCAERNSPGVARGNRVACGDRAAREVAQ